MQPGVVPSDFSLAQGQDAHGGQGEADQAASASVATSAKRMNSSQMHATGSVTDMSANWSAKVAVNAAAQVIQLGEAGCILAAEVSLACLLATGRQGADGGSVPVNGHNISAKRSESGCHHGHTAILWRH